MRFYQIINLAFIIFLILISDVKAEINIVTPEVYDQIMDRLQVSSGDIRKYRNIFKAVDKADFVTVDKTINKLDNQLLLGYVLAEKYLHNSYNSTKEELEEWLELYRDHPQASRIYKLAQRKGSEVAKEPVFASSGEDIDVQRLSLKYLRRLSNSDRNFLVRQAKNFRTYIRKGKTLSARRVLENKRSEIGSKSLLG